MLGQTNAKIAGGASVEEIKNDCLLVDDTQTPLSYSDISDIYCFKIDENNFVKATSTSPGGGSNTLYISKGFRYNSQVGSSVNLSFGQTYYYPANTLFGSMLSPNKDFMVLSGLNTNTNIFVIPLTKNGEDYSLGTPVSFDLQVSSGSSSGFTLHCFLDNNTFAYCISNAIHIFRYQNGEITELKVIPATTTIQNIKGYEGKLLILRSGTNTVIELFDYELETTVKTYTATSKSLGSYCLVYKDYGLFCSTNINTNYFLLDLDSFTEITLTKPSSVWTTTTALAPDDFLEIKDNEIIIAPNTYPSGNQKYYAFKFDFVNKIMSNVTVIPQPEQWSSQLSYVISFYYIEGILLAYSSSQGITRGNFYKFQQNFITQLIYKGYVYDVSNEASS